jgi:hypothetical protein
LTTVCGTGGDIRFCWQKQTLIGFPRFVIITIWFFPHSWSWPITGFVTILTQQVSHVEQEVITIQEHLSGIRVDRSFVFCVVFCRSLFVLFFCHCIFCPFCGCQFIGGGNHSTRRNSPTYWPSIINKVFNDKAVCINNISQNLEVINTDDFHMIMTIIN